MAIGVNCIINTAANVDHDCILADHIHICPGVNLAGGIKIGSNTMVGIGASIIPELQIGCNVVVGAGSTVIADIPDNTVVVGVPARNVLGKREGFFEDRMDI